MAMFTVLSVIIAIATMGWFAARAKRKDQEPVSVVADEVRRSLLHAAQGIKLIFVMLGAILIMLGIIADRLP